MKPSKHNELSEVQSWMQEALIYAGQQTESTDIEKLILPSDQLSPADRLAIYQRSYYARLLQCMREQFKALCHALGNQLFTEFARNYLEAIPPASPTLSDLGARFSEFLNTTRPDKNAQKKESWIDFMIDLARFEWDVYRIFDAPGTEHMAIIPEDLDPEKIKIQPCFELRKYDFPVNEYYRAVSHKQEASIPFEEKTCIAISRKDYMINITRLYPIQYHVLCLIKGGLSVNDALERTAAEHNGSADKLKLSWNSWYNDWVVIGFFIPA